MSASTVASGCCAIHRRQQRWAGGARKPSGVSSSQRSIYAVTSRCSMSYEIGIRLYILGWRRPDRSIRQRFGQGGKELFGGHVAVEAQAAPARQQAGDSSG